MTATAQKRIQDIIEEFNPQRCDTDIVLTARSSEDYRAGTPGASLLARWNGSDWCNYGMFDPTSCFLVFEGQLYLALPKGYQNPTNTYALVNASDLKSLAERPFRISAAGLVQKDGKWDLVDIVNKNNRWVKFKTRTNVLDGWVHNVKCAPGNTLIHTPDGFYIHDSYTVQELFGTNSFRVPDANVQLGALAFAGTEPVGNNKRFIARTYVQGDDRYLTFSRIFMSSLSSSIKPYCRIDGMHEDGVALLYAQNDGKTLYFLSREDKRIVRADIGDSLEAEARDVLKLKGDHVIEYFKIFPHGEITHSKLD